MVNRIHDIMLEYCRMKAHEIAKKVNVSTKCAFNKLCEYLGMKKLSAKWVPHLLLVDQKRTLVTISKRYLDKLALYYS